MMALMKPTKYEGRGEDMAIAQGKGDSIRNEKDRESLSGSTVESMDTLLFQDN
jgi:hypothetical protein